MMLDYESLQVVCGVGIAALSTLAGIHTGKAKERAAQARLPLETATAEASSTTADANLLEAQTHQFNLLFQQLNTLTERLDTEMRRTTALQAEMLDLRKWAGKKLQLKDDQIAELKLRIQHLEQHNQELQTKLDRESRLAVSEGKARALIEVEEVKAEKLAHLNPGKEITKELFQIEAAIEANTQLTKEAVTHAERAYSEANTVSQKIVDIGLQVADGTRLKSGKEKEE